MIQDQPPPQHAEGPDCWLLVLKDVDELFPTLGYLVKENMAARRQTGIDRYGMPVRPHNGRNAVVDCFQEVLDAIVYARQAIEEGQAMMNTHYRELLRVAVAMAILEPT